MCIILLLWSLRSFDSPEISYLTLAVPLQMGCTQNLSLTPLLTGMLRDASAPLLGISLYLPSSWLTVHLVFGSQFHWVTVLLVPTCRLWLGQCLSGVCVNVKWCLGKCTGLSWESCSVWATVWVCVWNNLLHRVSASEGKRYFLKILFYMFGFVQNYRVHIYKANNNIVL